MNYALLNITVLVLTIMVMWRLLFKHASKVLWLTLVVVLALTAVFDSLIIAKGIVAYNGAKLLGVYIVRAPLEDFVYTIVSVLLVSILWEYYEHR